MAQASAMSQQPIPPQVSLRALREMQGITLAKLAADIRSQGVEISAEHINNVELGHRQASGPVMDAWARSLGIRPLHIRQGRELRHWLQGIHADEAELEPAA